MKVQNICRVDGQVYLRRYKIFKCRWFKIRLHHILLSDYDCLHDHPWNFISIILKGGYFEKYSWLQHLEIRYGFIRRKLLFEDLDFVRKTWYGPFSFLYRRAEWKHALEIPEGKSCWSFVVMFKPRRKWGFWTKAGKWIFHKDYTPTQTCE